MLLLLAVLVLVNSQYLDPPYRKVNPDRIVFAEYTGKLPVANQIAELIARQSPVKSQQARGTCSIFSACAMVESLVMISQNQTAKGDVPDYSEEWLQYLISPGKTDSGSSSPSNIRATGNWGLPDEDEYPYIGQEWPTVNYSPLSRARCGNVSSSYQPSCLVGHRDVRLIQASDSQLADPTSSQYCPELLKARQSAAAMKANLLPKVQQSYLSSSQTKARLNNGFPVLLDIDFYYGAWNHKSCGSYGIPRNSSQWNYGIVTYPEPGSIDYKVSRQHRAGHSVLVVGYDDTIQVENTVKFTDGTTKDFVYKGVYVFKNSWGTNDFGAYTTYDSKIYPGYGLITQKYADQYGEFFLMSIN